MLILALLPAALAAQAPAPAAPQDVRPVPSLPDGERAPPGAPLTDHAALEAFVDGLMNAHLAERGIAGATVAVVHGGRTVLTKGYGFADVAARTPVDPARTLFRIGSVTKLFTTTAVMQLAEQGRLDLEADVNRYLDFEVPATFPEPITLTHLLTHTAGFEDELRLLFTYDPGDMLTSREWLLRTLPRRVRPPGTFAAYSNHGLALAGYIVERVSGVAWEDYIERHILQPLGMSHTTGRQPLPAALAGGMSQGYERTAGGWTAQRWEIIPGGAPAGSMSATAQDMTRFMLAHLGGGEVDGVRILREETVARMQARHFAHDPRLTGFGLGFYELSSHGQRIVGHGGNTAWFHSILALVPEHDLGIFASLNTNTAALLTLGPLLGGWWDHLFPAPPPRAAVADPQRWRGLMGTYRFNRLSYSTFQKVLGLGMLMSVEEADGALVARSMLGDVRLVEEEPLLFREELGQVRVAFRTDDRGRATHAFHSLAPMMALERVPWHGTPAVHAVAFGGGLVVFCGILVAAILRALRGTRGAPLRGHIARARAAITVAAAANVAFVAALAVTLVDFDPWEYLSSPLTGLRIALAFPVMGVIAAAAALVFLALAFRESRRDSLGAARAGSGWARLRVATAVVVAAVFAWSLNYWNLLGWRM